MKLRLHGSSQLRPIDQEPDSGESPGEAPGGAGQVRSGDPPVGRIHRGKSIHREGRQQEGRNHQEGWIHQGGGDPPGRSGSTREEWIHRGGVDPLGKRIHREGRVHWGQEDPGVARAQIAVLTHMTQRQNFDAMPEWTRQFIFQALHWVSC